MKVLNVAEKPAMAKQIASCLASHFNTTEGRNKYCKNFNFEYTLEGRAVRMVMTSVLGHVQELDFPPEYSNWQLTPPQSLLSSAPVVKQTPAANKTIVKNLEEQARDADWLVIWTDCDREGEHIGSEIVQICRRVNQRLQVYRARYSAVTAGELRRAMAQLQRMDDRQVAAVNVRSELDLRTGACFTRFQTLKLRDHFSPLQKEVISYGSCQFPTLGFVVDQYFKVKRFKPEPFWYLDLKVEKDGIRSAFTWKRGHLHDQLITLIVYERSIQSSNPLQVEITAVQEKPTYRYKPLPLRTVEFQKAASKFLKMSSDAVMSVAERLYNRGIISYPRTETDVFEFSSDQLHALIRKQSNDPQLGPYSNRLLSGEFSLPRKGKNNDKAHPPIHPTGPGADLSGQERSVFEFVCRRFLACCSQNAMGQETLVSARVGLEMFDCRGIRIGARNYLEIYPYDKWSESEVAPFVVGERLPPQEYLMQQGSTTAPPLLSEADLITCMDKNGIGTDATIHEHIHKIILRRYALKRHDSRFIPTRLGTALVSAYDRLGLEFSLTQPKLRSELERQLTQVCEGSLDSQAVLEAAKEAFCRVFGRLEEAFGGRMLPVFRRYLRGGNDGGDDGDENGSDDDNPPNSGNYSPFDPMPLANDDDSGVVDAREANNTKTKRTRNTTGASKKAKTSSTSTKSNSNANQRSNYSTTTNNSNYSTNTNNSSDNPQCMCGVDAVLRKVLKEGVNQGRSFYGCSRGVTDKCQFFSWADDGVGGGSNGVGRNNNYNNNSNYNNSNNNNYNSNNNGYNNTSSNYNNSNYNNQSNSNNNFSEKRCKCGLIMTRGDCHKGPNAGRSFLKCPKIVQKCGEFEFLDGEPSNENQRNQSNRSNGAKGNSKSKCYKCNKTGHWATNCPN